MLSGSHPHCDLLSLPALSHLSPTAASETTSMSTLPQWASSGFSPMLGTHISNCLLEVFHGSSTGTLKIYIQKKEAIKVYNQECPNWEALLCVGNTEPSVGLSSHIQSTYRELNYGGMVLEDPTVNEEYCPFSQDISINTCHLSCSHPASFFYLLRSKNVWIHILASDRKSHLA